MANKKKFRDDVRLAVELWGIQKVAHELDVVQRAVARWLRGSCVPDEGSKIYNKLTFLLNE